MTSFARVLDRFGIAYPKTRTIVLAVVAIFGIVSLAVYGNYAVGQLTFPICVGALFLWIVGVALVYRYANTPKWSLNEGSIDFNCAVSSFALWPALMSLCMCSFFFYNGFHRRDGQLWIINKKITHTEKLLFAIPFVHDIRGVSIDQNTNVSEIATTKDGIRVQGRVYAEFELDVKDVTTLQAVQHLLSPDSEIKAELENLLRRKFRDAVHRHDFADLQNTLALELEVGEGIPPHALSALGVKWGGVVQISDLHPSFTAKPSKELLIDI